MYGKMEISPTFISKLDFSKASFASRLILGKSTQFPSVVNFCHPNMETYCMDTASVRFKYMFIQRDFAGSRAQGTPILTVITMLCF